MEYIRRSSRKKKRYKGSTLCLNALLAAPANVLSHPYPHFPFLLEKISETGLEPIYSEVLQYVFSKIKSGRKFAIAV